MTIGYDKPTWMDWADEGGSLFGKKDVTKALQKGVSYQNILKAVQDSDRIAKQQNPDNPNIASGEGRFSTAANLTSAYKAAQQGRLDSGMGVSDYTGGADIALYAQGRGGMTGKVAQEIRDQANYNPNMEIGGKMYGNMMTIGTYAAGQDAADTARQEADAAATWRQQESDKRAQEAEKRYKAMIDAQEAAAEAARKEALKVKYQGATAVGAGQSAMGIKFAQSPAFASGAASRGTAQLARSDKGTKLTNLNIA